MKKKTVIERVAIFCVAVLGFFCISIMVRFLTRQVFVEKLHWNNAFTRFVFLDEAVLNAELDDKEAAIIEIDWEQRYPFKQNKEIQPVEKKVEISLIEKYKEIVDNLKAKVTDYAEKHLVGRMKIIDTAKQYNRLIGSPAMAVNSVDEIIYMNNGYLTYTQSLVEEENIKAVADNISNFADALKEKGIPFVYMNVGSKVCPYNRMLPKGVEEYSNENGDNLLDALNRYGIATLDFREYMKKDGLDWYQSYYITDHHWKTTTGLWAAGVVAEYLNQNCGFAFDKKFFDESLYDIQIFQKYLLGDKEGLQHL